VSQGEVSETVSGSIVIRTATPADAGPLAALAARTFSEAFGPDNTPEDLALHLARSYGVPQQSAELVDPALTSLLVEVDGEAAGYAQIKSGPPPESVSGTAPLEIMRFYLDRRWHGRGLAQQLMDATIEEARRRGAGTLWLGVWERNPRAIAFYAKCGFVSTGSKIFCVGDDEQKDLVMVKPLGPVP
jgi:diamine N-acetyltransferase